MTVGDLIKILEKIDHDNMTVYELITMLKMIDPNKRVIEDNGQIT